MSEDHPLEPRGYVGILAENTGLAQSVISLPGDVFDHGSGRGSAVRG
jgi:hypothetical protein